MKRLDMKWEFRLLALVVMALGIALFIYFKNSKPEQTPKQPEPRVWVVEAMTLDQRTLSPQLPATAKVLPVNTHRFTASVAAQVSQVRVSAGDSVAKGDVLATLDQREAQLKVASAKADVAEMNSAIALQEQNFAMQKAQVALEQDIVDLKQKAVERAQALSQKSLSSQANLDQAQEALSRQQLSLINLQSQLDRHPATMKQLQARLDKVKVQLDQSLLNLERSTVVAPFSGVVSDVNVTTGALVNPGQALLSFYGFNQLEMEVSLPQLVMSSIDPYQLNLELKLPNSTLRLPLSRLNAEVSANALKGRFALPELDETTSLRSGDVMNVSIVLPEQSGVYLLPYSALYDDNLLYRIVNQGDKQVLQSVIVERTGNWYGEQGEALAVIRADDLQPGDWIMTTHLSNAIAGLAVTVKGAP